jgi:23S rRNA (guanosine2251-2'-O)-methyltransferase
VSRQPPPRRGPEQPRGNRQQRDGREARGARESREPREAAPRGLGGEQVEGRQAVRELLAVGRRRVKAVYVSQGAEPAAILEEITALAGPIVRTVSAEKLRSLARSESHQGVVATTTPLQPADIDDLLAHPAAFLVALDGVTDPGNLGSVLRSAAAFGATGVVLPRHRSAHVTPAVTKVAAGAIEHLAIAQVSGIASAMERATRAGVWTVGLDADGATDVEDLTVADAKVMLVLGSEGRGLSRLVEQRCDVIARIQIASGSESLNASVAAAVACHEIARRRRTAGQ